MTDRVVAAIDQGTTSTRCLLFNPAGRMVAVAQREHRQYYPRSCSTPVSYTHLTLPTN